MLRFFSLFACVLFACVSLVLAAFAGGTVILVKCGVQAQSRGCESSGGCYELTFDSRDWQTYGNLTEPIRLWMVDDLMNAKDMAHQTREWVDANLGTPDKNDRLAPRFEYSYWLGPVQALISVNADWLRISFSGDSMAEAKVVESP